MNISKKLLTIVFISLYSNNISTMELQPNQKVLLQAPASHMTEKIEEYADDGDISHITTLGTWLNLHRNKITDNNKWEKTVKDITVAIHLCRCLCLENRKKMALKKIVEEIALKMQPNEDCLEILISRTQEVCTICTEEHQAEGKKDWESL